MKTLPVVVGLIGALAGQANVPDGYRFPGDNDYSGDWKAFREQVPTPFVVRADFNDDAVIDEAWLLPARSGNGWGLFAALGDPNGTGHFIRLEQDGKSDVQRFGLRLVRPGRYRTACGKGYWACAPGEPEVLDLEAPAFELFMFESSSSIFWWDRVSASFKRTWTSD